ncbi:hypothetical protein [Chryseobacterium vrystaatense]|uniref:Uncharacterized protein n=1 Tax=Chryseobacterium vrystaatense TaxID=307480 RepID=A0A1M5HBA2_9FLAO|nr:hypothetical protein [Chryseobacterium vrystaatense]SHG13259.1 hypothetical protein SAMN02787073_3644 [Chryseobacterium vrystaatense]
MKNCKKPGWIEELQKRLDDEFGVLSLTSFSFKEDKITDHSRQEIPNTPLLKKENS